MFCISFMFYWYVLRALAAYRRITVMSDSGFHSSSQIALSLSITLPGLIFFSSLNIMTIFCWCYGLFLSVVFISFSRKSTGDEEMMLILYFNRVSSSDLFSGNLYPDTYVLGHCWFMSLF